jgi:HEPN domain-containing protein
MRNTDLARDYIERAAVRLRALDVLFDAESWADVVRESQEVVELALHSLLLGSGVDQRSIDDVPEMLLFERERLPAAVAQDVETLAGISRGLRRDRELAFYGAEDLTPSGFYSKADAEKARSDATMVVESVKPHIETAS